MKLLLLLLALPALAQDTATFTRKVQPFFARTCYGCHNATLRSGDMALDSYREAGSALGNRDLFERVVEKLKAGQMPPANVPRPKAGDVKNVTRWFEREWTRIDRSASADPGRVTAHRLNRTEYNNTIRDLLELDAHPADNFPADDSGYGFDNISDVLSVSPVLMERYLDAADKIVQAVIAVPVTWRATRDTYRRQGGRGFEHQARHKFPVEAEYDVRAVLGGKRNDPGKPLRFSVALDGERVKDFEVDVSGERPRDFESRISLKAGEHAIHAAIEDTTFGATIDTIEIRGPYNVRPAAPGEAHRRVVICGHYFGEHKPECARQVMAAFARRAYRRPVSDAEVENLARFIGMVEKESESFEAGVRVALKAALVSPHFLFRIERDPRPGDPTATHRVTEHELASRLSYFLWSSMPDKTLLAVADDQQLRKPGVLEAQVRRMLLDPKSAALVENFMGQWLELRNLELARPDPGRFPEFDNDLRDSMRRETTLFFESIIRENRPILDFLDARYTFLNERLARFYGIGGITGEQFRRVELALPERGGVLTQASVLTVSSYPTRTSPVLRGKYLLENFLNAPTPPPPANVPNLSEEGIGASVSLREQLQKHRADAACATCHNRLDPLGFALENYDAIGRWRTHDGKFPIDAAGELPGGKKFAGAAGLRELLLADRAAFTEGLAARLLTYALGRGLERYDRRAVQSISRAVAKDGYRFERLVLEIVNSLPFQMRRGDGGKP